MTPMKLLTIVALTTAKNQNRDRAFRARRRECETQPCAKARAMTTPSKRPQAEGPNKVAAALTYFSGTPRSSASAASIVAGCA